MQNNNQKPDEQQIEKFTEIVKEVHEKFIEFADEQTTRLLDDYNVNAKQAIGVTLTGAASALAMALDLYSAVFGEQVADEIRELFKIRPFTEEEDGNA